MVSNFKKSIILGISIRCLLLISNFGTIIQNRIEVSTPINSWKRGLILFIVIRIICFQFSISFIVKEGAFLYANNINPYNGDIYHENPLVLIVTNFLIKYFEQFLPCLFVIMDIAASNLLMKAVKVYIYELVSVYIYM